MSCGKATGFNDVKKVVDEISSAPLFPYYRVAGYLDFNNEVMTVDATFDKTPSSDTFVPYARYNDGFYCPSASTAESAEGKDNTMIYMMASRSYWLRAPLRLTKDNFYRVDEKGKENKTCGHYILEHIITSYIDEPGAINPSSNKMKYEILDNGGFAFVGEESHTIFRIDNYPYYPDVATHPELDEWDPDFPLPCYANQVNAKVYVRFEYNKDGWLVKESLRTADYDYQKASAAQVALESTYSYKFAQNETQKICYIITNGVTSKFMH